ncbi:MAG: hypothetical protein KKD31_11330 [Bacteroidetes bacterium]|nr:hypothetical protein [Bacteroidota bacterium]
MAESQKNESDFLSELRDLANNPQLPMLAFAYFLSFYGIAALKVIHDDPKTHDTEIIGEKVAQAACNWLISQ